MCTFLLQNAALWDICLMNWGIYEMGLLCEPMMAYCTEAYMHLALMSAHSVPCSCEHDDTQVRIEYSNFSLPCNLSEEKFLSIILIVFCKYKHAICSWYGYNPRMYIWYILMKTIHRRWDLIVIRITIIISWCVLICTLSLDWFWYAIQVVLQEEYCISDRYQG